MIKKAIWISNAMLCGMFFVPGCGGVEAPLPAIERSPGLTAAKLPYARVASGTEDPGQNGPDDATVLDAVKGTTKPVPFSHFTHASNKGKGYGIPCRACHHKTEAGKDPEEGCVDCHALPKEGGDPADQGPDDNLILTRPGQKMIEAPFTHFTHASAGGHRIACEKCHHTGDKVDCNDCHEAANGNVEIPSARRAFHLKCKDCHRAENARNKAAKAPVRCADCHHPFERQPSKEAVSLTRAMHLQCIDCHYRVGRANPKAAAPVRACDGCHRALPPPASDAGVSPEPSAAGAVVSPTPAAEAAAPAAEAESPLEKNKGAAALTIEHVKPSKPGVAFSHKAHQELGEPCARCHHKGLADPSCRKCHAEMKNAKNAYHKSCIPCHRENGIGTKCGDCHKG